MTCWFALTDAYEENGCVYVLPRSKDDTYDYFESDDGEGTTQLPSHGKNPKKYTHVYKIDCFKIYIYIKMKCNLTLRREEICSVGRVVFCTKAASFIDMSNQSHHLALPWQQLSQHEDMKLKN